MVKNPRIAIIGATGMVGRELIKILEERNFRVSSLQLFASKKSKSSEIDFAGESLTVEELNDPSDIKADIAFFAAGSAVSLAYIEQVAKNGTICIDKSSAFRMVEGVPLVVPEVNGHLLKDRSQKIIASPNCVVTPLVQVLAPLLDIAQIERVLLSSYQAVSGVGQDGVLELETQVRHLFNMRDVDSKVFGQRIAFNVLPFIPAHGPLDSLGKTDEEAKVIEESKKILGSHLKIEATCVRVPVFVGHSMAVNIFTKGPIKIADALDRLKKAPGIIVKGHSEVEDYPTPLDAGGEDMTLVGRIRPNTAADHGLSLWISSDNLRTGAALNAVRIAEAILME